MRAYLLSFAPTEGSRVVNRVMSQIRRQVRQAANNVVHFNSQIQERNARHAHQIHSQTLSEQPVCHALQDST